jgi:hypothetical protein
VCPACKHAIARHEYTLEVVDGYQEHEMTCDLVRFSFFFSLFFFSLALIFYATILMRETFRF